MPHTRKAIKCSQLTDLYTKKHLSLFNIGKILGYSSRTIQIKAKECHIKLRKPGNAPPKISDATLTNLYLTKRLSSRKIAKIYGCAYSYIDTRVKNLNIPRRSLASAHISTKRVDFSGDLFEKAYLIGFSIGDLRVRKIYKNSETLNIDCGSTKPNQILLIKQLFRNYGRVWIGKLMAGGKIQIEVSVNLSFLFLLKKYQLFPLWATKNWAMFLNILAGFVDAEGSFFVSQKRKVATFALGNYNKMLLEQIERILKAKKFHTRLRKGVRKGYTGKDGYTHRQDYWVLVIFRKADVYRFAHTLLPFLKHRDRISCAKKVIKNIEFRNQKFGFKGLGMLNFSHDR